MGLLILIAPIEPNRTPSATAFTYALACAAAAAGGLALSGSRRKMGFSLRNAELGRTMRFTVVLALCGNALLSYDRFVLRGAPLGFEIFATREALEQGTSGLISTLAAFGSAFAMFAPAVFGLAAATGSVPKRSVWRPVAWFAAVVYLGLSVMAGSRSLVLVFAILNLIAASHSRAIERALGRAVPADRGRVVLLLVALTVFSTWMMLLRLDEMGLDPVTSLAVSGYAEQIRISPWLLELVEAVPALSSITATLLGLLLYLCHGAFEFFALFDDYASVHTLGAEIGWLPLKVLGVVTGKDYAIDYDALNGFRAGVFTTFVGPLYLDFGFAGPLFAFVLFAVLGLPQARVANGRLAWSPFVWVVGTVCVMFPVVNLISAAAGSYAIFAAILIAAFGSRPAPQRRRAVNASVAPLRENPGFAR
jgi:hypothetical protein